MRLLTCLAFEHDLRLVVLAAVMAVLGCAVVVRLAARTLAESGLARGLWCFLAAVTAGAAIWATHFIAMLGFHPGVPVSFDGALTIGSALIATAGAAVALLAAAAAPRHRAVSLVAGLLFGLAVAAMHYVGMLAYRVDGVVSWRPAYVAASLLFAVVPSAAAFEALRRDLGRRGQAMATGLLVAAIVLLHFTGMAAFVVVPLPGVQAGAHGDVLFAMASAIAAVSLIIVGTGISTWLVEERTRLESRARLHHVAMHDALTGLANRHSYGESLAARCARLAAGEPFALLLLDLDNFKPVNDTLGHPAGDEVLRRVAGRLRRAVRGGDTVARIGGDEFAVIAPGLADPAAAAALADRMVEVLARPFLVGGNIAELGGSVGVALAPVHGATVADLSGNADVALYTAKRLGRRRACFFDADQGHDLDRRRRLEADLRRACMRDEFHVAYQPIVRADGGAYSGAEALVRWTCPGRGDVPPSDFVPLAEELGLITRIGATVLRQACLDAAGWPGELGVAVNLSPVQLLDPRLPQLVTGALEDAGLAAHRLELEITETALLGNDEVALRSLDRLRALGVRIALDDFGTGYSSLSYLHRFPIGRIKIDRSFVQRLPDDPGSASIVRAITQLGTSLGMQITAEGIETDAQLGFFARQGCHDVQGYLLSRPVPADTVARLFGAEPARVAA